MSNIYGFEVDAMGRPTWRAQLRMVLANLEAGFSVLWRASLGMWFCGIGWWWLWADPVSTIYAFVTGLQMGMRCPADRLGLTARGWQALEMYVAFVPPVVGALPAELLLVGGLLLIVSAVRRVVR